MTTCPEPHRVGESDPFADSVVGIVAGVAAGRSPAEVLARHVDRIRAGHARVNALAQERFAEAAAEAALIADRPPGPLAAVPVSVKECFPVRGLATTLGLRGRRGRRDDADADVVSRLRAAGAIVVGKGNVPQALYLHETDNPVWGRTLHPFSAERGPGGSSGGDAALVARGDVAIAVGNDLAGSVRQPAHACGIVGFLPRRATLGGGGAVETMPGVVGERSRCGLLARSVDDVAAGFFALCESGASTDPFPPSSRSGPPRVGWWDGTGPLAPSAAVRRGVKLAVERLARGGAIVERLDPVLAAEAAWIHLALLSADGGADIRRLFAGERPIPEVGRLLRLAGLPGWARGVLAGAAAWGGRRIESEALRRTGPCSAERTARVLAGRSDVDAAVARWAESHDFLLCPVSAVPALRHGTASRLVLAAAPCMLASLLDLAAAAVPVTTVLAGEDRGRERSRDPVERAAAECDQGSEGLPVGVQLIALDRTPHLAERSLLALMAVLEAATRSDAAPISPVADP